MYFFDFHHHTRGKDGIYNLNYLEKDYPGTYSVGLHPKDIPVWDNDGKSWLEDYSISKNCLALGECGLDSFVDSNLEVQEQLFKQQIEWANKINKPIIIHCVRMFHRMSSFKKIAKTPLIIHGFNKKATIAEDLLKNGFYLSFGKALLHDVSLQQIFIAAPQNRIFLETDAAELDIRTVYEKAAELKKLNLNDLNEIIHHNLEYIQHGY